MEKVIDTLVASVEFDIPELPDYFTTASGANFNPRLAHWIYRDGIDNIDIDFSKYKYLISSELIAILKAVLMHSTLELAPRATVSLDYSFHKFCLAIREHKPIRSLEFSHIKYFWKKEKIIHYKSRVRQIFIRWYAHRYPGVNSESVSYLKEQKIKFTAGEAVLTWCPLKGPLTNVEFHTTYDALLEAYGSGEVSQQLFLMTWLTVSLGLRPRQIALLKVADFVEANDNGVVTYKLDVARIKQKSQALRDELYTWKIIREIGVILSAQAKISIAFFKDVLTDPNQAPLFFRDSYKSEFLVTDNLEAIHVDGTLDEDWESEADGFSAGYDYHLSPSNVSDRIQYGFRKLNVHSERVGKTMPLNPARMRKTYGTRLAAAGHSSSIIATLMTHRTIRSSKPYIAATSGLQYRLDRALAFELAPLAQAFKGELLTDWNDEDDSPIVRDLRVTKSTDPIGKCGKHGFCGFAAPIACYTCKKFRPWLDGPHNAIFEYLWEKRAHRADKKIKNDSNMIMMHDKTIIAVAHVIMKCEQFRRENK